MSRDIYFEALRTELLTMVQTHLSPVSLRYGYSDAPLETNIKWRPLVLVMGNYSAGKSAMINEFLGADIQTTGQAPTDDSFTILTWDDPQQEDDAIGVIQERDGKFLLNNPDLPFELLKKHGQRFASHFRLKTINSPFLRSLAIIDTPGMIDSIAERDRGYNYQEVIGDLAQIADLILVLFDPHKAGTVREAHLSLRETLPARTFEDRVLFVLNRIDECSSLTDLLRVYGTLCWNLSQITGRKDIPLIHLSYSPRATLQNNHTQPPTTEFLPLLDNQREELAKAVLQAPRHRLDNLISFAETHSERLSHFLEALLGYRRQLRHLRIRQFFWGLLAGLFTGGITTALMFGGILPGGDPVMMGLAGGAVGLVTLGFWLTAIMRFRISRFRKEGSKKLDALTPLETQTRKDSWEAVRAMVAKYLDKTGGKYSLWDVKEDYRAVSAIYKEGTREIREALNEISAITAEGNHSANPGPYLSAILREQEQRRNSGPGHMPRQPL